MVAFTLSTGQQRAYDDIVAFLADPSAHTFIIAGYAGTGKSTLISQLLNDITNIFKTVKLLSPNSFTDWDILLTATTNKAAEALNDLSGLEVRTIQSTLGLVVEKDIKTGKTSLKLREGAEVVENSVIFVDEASYVDHDLLRYILELPVNCKIIFIGDPAQLAPVNSKGVPAFTCGIKGTQLTEVMRQAKGNPIIDLATAFRHTVNTGEFFSFTPDGQHIQHLSGQAFSQAVINECSRPDWHYKDSKVLVWTNKAVANYNQTIRSVVKGNPVLEAGDYALNNSYIRNGKQSLKTDERVKIEHIQQGNQFGYDGHFVRIGPSTYFLPENIAWLKAVEKEARSLGDWEMLKKAQSTWIDLRPEYACTINKSQGSTYDKVFIDLSDIGRCTNGNTMARLLYVAVSRARSQVILTGDLV